MPRAPKSYLENMLLNQIRYLRLPEPEREFRFAPLRRFRADFAYPGHKILIECEGGTWINGRHNRAAGFEKDCEKYNLAAELGYLVLRYTRRQIESWEAVNQIRRVLQKRETPF